MPNTPEITRLIVCRDDQKVLRVELPIGGEKRIGTVRRDIPDSSVEQTAQELTEKGIEVHVADIGGQRRVITLDNKVRLTRNPR